MNHNDLQGEVLRASPIAGVSVASFLGITLQDWMYAATIVYIVVQCVCLIIKTRRGK